jgi:hypothetical protein
MAHGVAHGALCGGGAARAAPRRCSAARGSAAHARAAPRRCHAGGGSSGGGHGGHSSGGGGSGGGGDGDDSSHRFRRHRAAALAAAAASAAALSLSAPRAARAGLLPADLRPSLGTATSSSSGGDADDSDTERLRRLTRESFRELLDAKRRLRDLEEHTGLHAPKTLGALAAARVSGGSKSSSGSVLRVSGRLSGAAGAAQHATHALRRAGVASVRAHTCRAHMRACLLCYARCGVRLS